jgi:hypothetical protein
MLYSVLRKGLQAQRGYSTYLNEQKFQVSVCPGTTAYWDMGDVCVISTADAVCGSHAFQHNFQLFIAQRCTLLKISGFTWIFWQEFCICCFNTSKSLMSAEYTKSLVVPTTKNAEAWDQGIVQASWLGLCVLATVHLKSGLGAVWHCGESEVVSHHARSTYVVIDEEAHVPRELVNHSPKSDGILHVLVC